MQAERGGISRNEVKFYQVIRNGVIRSSFLCQKLYKEAFLKSNLKNIYTKKESEIEIEIVASSLVIGNKIQKFYKLFENEAHIIWELPCNAK